MAKDLKKFRGMTVDELVKEEVALRETVWKLRVQRTTGQLQAPQKIRQARKDLARLLTVRREMELKAARGGSDA